MKDLSKRVYFAKCIGPMGQPIGAYKIGCSYNHNGRIQSVAANLPFSLELVAAVPGDFVMETACHIHLKEHRIGGEYFHASEQVEHFIQRAAETGMAFRFFHDSGAHRVPEGGVDAFMAYHGVSLSDACKFLGVPLKAYEGKSTAYRSRKLVAAVALIAARRGQFVNWPADIAFGLTGEVDPTLQRLGEKARAA